MCPLVSVCGGCEDSPLPTLMLILILILISELMTMTMLMLGVVLDRCRARL